MSSPAANVRHGTLHKGLALAIAILATGCATGNLSRTTVVGPEAITDRQYGAEAFDNRRCFHYGGRPTGGPSVLPGDRLRLAVWSAGTQDLDNKNTHPPIVRTVDVRLREVNPSGGHLDVDEQQALATFLQVNRSRAWVEDAGSEGDGLTRPERQKLAAALKTHEAAVWNAFVGSLCVKAIAPSKNASAAARAAPVLVVQADIRAICRALPGRQDRQRFARAFLVTGGSDSEYLKGCAAARLTREPMTVFGVRGDTALGSWASAALAANPGEADNYYAQEWVLASPKALQGTIEFDAVAPFQTDPPTWSLKEWEDAGICLRSPKLKIKALRLRGSSQQYRIVDDPNLETTHNVVLANGKRDLVTLHKQTFSWSLPVSVLSVLTASDVDELVWASNRTPQSKTVSPMGCAARGEG
ncbi:MAG: hypothetical protein E5Y06_12440 [Mesorhizobium sp.]|uniref:hypothetical protein n=1 Tax=Mesorhizobium sp. TaxID=1871066 RepID=UPI00121C6FD2|nr:hypothetical protein [Mesorhizobium sp.]TIN95552.1 MAG: hypothetical protein E5Y06_12440 [Mesorhizobium sp.]TJU97199.1 MAG: hypothetical protein E5Y08_19030 [Mesorhizobium sp.]